MKSWESTNFGWFVLLASMFGLAVIAETGDVKNRGYFILIDAGSSGSRIHVHPFIDQEPMPVIERSLSLKITPGLSSYEHDPKAAAQSLVKLLEFAKKNIPELQWQSTPVHLMATAGLRSIPHAAAETILEECRLLLKQFPFKFQPTWASIIPGTMEGVYGWISANYLEGTLADPASETVGVIEMGGASLQITYVPHEQPMDMKDIFVPVTIGSRTFLVYTHSYLNYGLEAAQRLFASKHRGHIDSRGHPCDLKGTPSGRGEHSECSKLMDALFDKNCSRTNCGFNGVSQPRITKEKFYAIENFHYTSSFFGVSTHPDPYAELERLGKDFCRSHLDELQQKYPKETAENLSKYCFSSIYLRKVVKNGFGIHDPNVTARIRHDVNGVKIDWALGAVLYHMLAAKQVDRATTPSLQTTTPPELMNPSRPPDVVTVIARPYSSIHQYPDLDSPGLPDRISAGSYLMGVSILICALFATYRWRESRPKQRGIMHPQEWNAPV